LGADSHIRESKCAENADLVRLVLSVPFVAKRPAPAGGTYSSNPLPSSSQSVSAVNPEAIGEKPCTLAVVCGWLGT
jgi:hypothetical protein